MKNNTLINKVIEILIEKRWDISIAESSTGGLFSSSFFNLDNDEMMDFFKGGVIANNEISKMNLCSVKTLTMEKHGEVSKEVAVEMAYGIKTKLKTNVSIGITGNSESNLIDNKQMGIVYFCIIIDEMIYDFEMIIPYSGKQRNKIIISQKVLEELYKSLINI